MENVKTKITDAYSLLSSLLSEKKSLKARNGVKGIDTLMKSIKEELKYARYTEKVQILTIAPKSWFKKKITKYFEVSKYLVL